MKKPYFLFATIRYFDENNIPIEQVLKKIQSAIGCSFDEAELKSSGLAEKRYLSEVLGIEIRLEYWKHFNGLMHSGSIYTLAGATEIYSDWKQENIVNLNDYLIDLFDSKGMHGWYKKTKDEHEHEANLCGGESSS